MEVDEYFLKGKMYVYGGIPDVVWQYYTRMRRKPRRWYCIEGVLGELGRYFPKVGDYFMCLGVYPGKIRINSDGDTKNILRIKFLTPNSKIILDSCNKVTQNTMEKWQIVPEHFEQTV